MDADDIRDLSTPISQSKEARRSRKSLEFETFWRSLPKEALLPHRRDFNPARAASLLRSIMLLEVRLEAVPALPIRLVGSALVEAIQCDIKGSDFLEFLSVEQHAEAIETARLMLHRPCGLWQITALHYERGFAQNFEVTAFPVLGEPFPFVIAIALPLEDLVRPISSGDRAMLAGAATEYEFLDIGADLPSSPLR